MTTCTYVRCMHRDPAARQQCRMELRNARLRELDQLESLIREERAQLLADKFRNLDIMFPPDQETPA